MVEKWRENMNNSNSCAVLLTDLRKAFDSIVLDFLIAKPKVHDFSYEALQTMYKYLTDRNYKTEVNEFLSDFINYCSVSLMTKIHIQTVNNVAKVLEIYFQNGKEVFSWFPMNYLKANPDKFQLLLTLKVKVSIKIDDRSSYNNLLEVLIDDKLIFSRHVSKLCKKF